MIAKVIRVKAHFTDRIIPVKVHFTENIIRVKAELVNRITTSQAEEYDGSYEITSFLAAPSMTTSQYLHTRNKLMRDNVTVYSVPTSEEYNPQGGVTFTIGS